MNQALVGNSTLSLEEQWLAQQRLESVGLMVSGVVHDFNNLLQIISSNCSLEQIFRQEEGLPASVNLSDILDACERARIMTQQLLNFSIRQPTARVNIDLNAVMTEIMNLIQRWLPKQIQCSWKSNVIDGRVNFTPGQLHQVALNLAINARDAMVDEGGHLWVTLEAEKGDFRLSFSDSGVGMTEGQIEKIFDPFYTTKGSAGTGLGLSTVKSIISDHGGRIEVHSKPGEGTTFQVFIPRA